MIRSIMIFGASLNQLELINEARALGLESVVIDPQLDPPGKSLADHYYVVPGDDYERTKEIALKHNVSGIVTGQMEKPLRLMSRLACELGCIFHAPDVIDRSTDKYLMKKTFQKNAVACAKGILISNGRVLSEDEISTFNFPLIIKPTQSYSSRGVFKIRSYLDYLQYLPDTLGFSSNLEYLIEEFIEGPEYSVETITYNGETSIVQFTEKIITPYPHTVEIGHIQPAQLARSQKKQISEIVIKGVEALGIDNSAAHTELKLTDLGPVIIEIGPRLGGDFISSYLTAASTGISMDKAAIQVAIGDRPDLVQRHKRCSIIMYLTLPAGKRVLSINPIVFKKTTNIIMQHIAVKAGDLIPELSDSAKRPGWAIVQAVTRKKALELSQAVVKNMTLSIIME